MTNPIDLEAARQSLGEITVEDPRIAALRQLMPDIRTSLKSGAAIKQIAIALAPHFSNDEKFLIRTIAELRRARGGRRKKTIEKAERNDITQPKPARKTLTLSGPAQAQAEA